MQGYNNGTLWPFTAVHYNAYVEASTQDYIKGSLGAFITVHYND
jgi:hypothetical protein